ncbi:Asp23/Gls24 family envelope stress response protein [Caminicella sporogenes]|uniref:Asp23/Gls24 family envelope stress response protein n=1 Tax=Caminicella sporogenes TaxID=166485 RepID=UPI0025401F05|nr:Asp23/Gls24 family envelope stress response protein [Caminicella sporogenes]WIF94595.1 Asp23/Gls24 family envelope stress response protein [Caminicella sporogenes]
MAVKLENEYGYIYINSEVISSIAGAAAMECYGLVGMASKSAAGGIVKLLKRENLSKGVKVHIEENYVIIDLFVIVQFGTKISVVAQNIIDKVKYSVEEQIGLKVKKININIEGVRVQA